MNNKFSKNKGITLIALVITIIILLILAGVTIAQLTENGLFEKAIQAIEKNKKAEIKEELQLAISQVEIELMEESNTITIEEIVQKLKEIKNIETLDNDGTNGKYKGYEFYINSNTFEVVLTNKIESENTEPSKMNENYIIFRGGTYIDTGVQQEELIKNNKEFTIATQVYINRDMQSKIAHMDILGNHNNSNGFVWQFQETSSTLLFLINGITIEVDYTPYYEKWTKIAMTYNNGIVKVYIDNQLIETKDNMILNTYNSILIGTGYTIQDRTMKGAIKSVKIWGKELSHDNIKQINYNEEITNIQKEKIIKEINFNNNEEILEMIIGANYSLVPIEKEIGYEFKWYGGNYLDINLPQSEILENSEFTIAAKVKINSNEQKSVSYMGILGNHMSSSGILWQFLTNTSTLQIGVGTQGQVVNIDYTEYYDKYTDIVMVYKERVITMYINGEKITEQEDIDITAYNNFYIGNAYNDINRGMVGYLPYVKIWSKALNDNQIENLKLEENTNIEITNILKELDLTTLENINNYGTLVNNNYQITMVGK